MTDSNAQQGPEDPTDGTTGQDTRDQEHADPTPDGVAADPSGEADVSPDAAESQGTTPESATAREPEPSAPAEAAAVPDFAELQPGTAGGGRGSLAMLYDLMMPVSVELGRTAMSVRAVLELGRGSVIPLNRLAGEPVDIYVSDRKLAEGEVVVLGEHFGVRLTRVLPSSGGVTASEPEPRTGAAEPQPQVV